MPLNSKTLHAFFGQPPEVAIRYLEDKQLVPSKVWHEIRDEAHNQAFTVANLARIDLLGDIKQSLIDAQKKGLTLQEWRENITPQLKAKGWWGKDTDGKEMGSPWRLETIYRTNLQSAYMAGRRHEMLQAADTHPYWRYVAIMDSKTRPAHRALHGRVMRADDPAWDTIFPPCGFNCRCRVSPMTAGAVERGGYKVESSDGHLSTEIANVGYANSATVTKLKLPSMDIAFKTDAGFNAAPLLVQQLN
ncbi:phage head morphogenesis protein [Acinetobacter haemolyticus]|nr:phage head morphogenesis protein [Acinetobacter haemolyticus]